MIIEPVFSEVEPVFLKRFDSGGDRYYLYNDRAYISVTTMIHKVYGVNPYLLNWIEKFGSKYMYEQTLNELAEYGTFYGIQCNNLLLGKELPVSEQALIKYIIDYRNQNSIKVDISSWVSKFRDDIGAFWQFVKDREVTPIAIELGVVNESMGYAGCIDLVCELTFNKKRRKVIIDIKSGNPIYEVYAAQLKAYQLAYNQLYEPVDYLFNFAPKKWLKYPTYEFLNRTNDFSEEKLKAIYDLYKPLKEKNITEKTWEGVLTLDTQLTDLYTINSYGVNNDSENGAF